MAGRFSAGADVSIFSGDDLGGARRAAADAGRQMVEAIESMRAITIARIHGHCVGGAVLLAVACDLRVAADTTRFSIPELQLGIPLGWGGIPRLVREIGPAMTKELVLTCRPFTAEEARELGLVNRVVAEQHLSETVEELAGQLAERSTLTLAATKLGGQRRQCCDGRHLRRVERCRRAAHRARRPRIAPRRRELSRTAR